MCSVYAEVGTKVKKCATCDQVKPRTEFHKDSRSKDGYRSRCKDCRHTIEYKYKRKRHRGQKYGLTKKKVKKMQEKQGHKCLICGDIDYLVIDHSHSFGHVRGMLCQRCNKGLGFFLDSPRRLLNAIKYLLQKEIFKKRKNNRPYILNFRNIFVSL